MLTSPTGGLSDAPVRSANRYQLHQAVRYQRRPDNVGATRRYDGAKVAHVDSTAHHFAAAIDQVSPRDALRAAFLLHRQISARLRQWTARIPMRTAAFPLRPARAAPDGTS